MSEESVPVEMMTVALTHSGPIELSELSDSLNALAASHARYADASGATINKDHVKLYVREIRQGSIIIDLVALAATAGSIFGPINTVVGFAKHLGGMIDYFRGTKSELPEDVKPRDVADMNKVLAPIVNDHRATLNIEAHDGSVININYLVNSTEANAAQNRAKNWLADHAEPVHGFHSEQLFYFFQARGETDAATGDRGVIEAISPNPVRTIFSNEPAKAEMLNEALFQRAYIVDVDVQTIKGKPKLYRIIAVHDSIDR